MSRTKQINVSIPAAQVPLLEEFDAHCKSLGLSRSEVLLELMSNYVASNDIGCLSELAEDTEHASNDPLPEWLL